MQLEKHKSFTITKNIEWKETEPYKVENVNN
jgi:hypothetical protein